MDSPVHPGTPTSPALDRRHLEQRLLRAPDCGLRKCALARRPCAQTRAGKDARWAPSHVDLHDRPYFHRPFAIEDRAALGQFTSALQIAGFDPCVATHYAFGLR